MKGWGARVDKPYVRSLTKQFLLLLGEFGKMVMFSLFKHEWS